MPRCPRMHENLPNDPNVIPRSDRRSNRVLRPLAGILEGPHDRGLTVEGRVHMLSIT